MSVLSGRGQMAVCSQNTASTGCSLSSTSSPLRWETFWICSKLYNFFPRFRGPETIYILPVRFVHVMHCLFVLVSRFFGTIVLYIEATSGYTVPLESRETCRHCHLIITIASKWTILEVCWILYPGPHFLQFLFSHISPSILIIRPPWMW